MALQRPISVRSYRSGARIERPRIEEVRPSVENLVQRLPMQGNTCGGGGSPYIPTALAAELRAVWRPKSYLG